MKIFKLNYKNITNIFFVIFILSTTKAVALDKFNKSAQVSNYFSGILLLNDNQYEKSFNFLKKLNGLETSHINYSVKYLYSLVNSGNLKGAFNYSKKLEGQKLDSFESYLITGIFYFRNSNIDLAQKYFLKAKNKNPRLILNDYVSNSLYNWSTLDDYNLKTATEKLEKLDQRFENLKKIQNIFLNCYFNSPNTNNLYEKLLSNEKTDFSRYNYFYASFAASSKKMNKAKEIVNSALKFYPRNLLLNQYKLDLNHGNNIINFDCKNIGHVIAEILYITSNALSSQSIYPLSNFYLNLAKYLNEEFHSYDTLLAENFYKVNNYEKAKKIYYSLSKKGKAFKWYSSKQLAKIYNLEENKKKALKLISDAYTNLAIKDLYKT